MSLILYWFSGNSYKLSFGTRIPGSPLDKNRNNKSQFRDWHHCWAQQLVRTLSTYLYTTITLCSGGKLESKVVLHKGKWRSIYYIHSLLRVWPNFPNNDVSQVTSHMYQDNLEYIGPIWLRFASALKRSVVIRFYIL
jgi:hypothetical protein